MIELEMVETTYLDRARENNIRFGNGSPARGRVFRDPTGLWHSVVFCQNKLVLYDNCVHLAKMQDYCRRDVVAANRMVRAGHDFHKSYPQILRERERARMSEMMSLLLGALGYFVAGIIIGLVFGFSRWPAD